MKLTIIREDNAVIVDGEHQTVDCSDLPADFHALQWDGTSGEIEYAVARCEHCGARSKKGNAIISDIIALAPYQKYVNQWRFVKIAAETEAKLLRERARDATGSQG